MQLQNEICTFSASLFFTHAVLLTYYAITINWNLTEMTDNWKYIIVNSNWNWNFKILNTK